MAELRAHNTIIRVGRFLDKEQAAAAYQQKRKQILGDDYDTLDL